MRFIFLSICLTVMSPQITQAMLFYDLDNNANTTDPGTGVPFDAVARVTTTTTPTQLSHLSGTAVHLGGGYMLTANHVNTGAGARISFDGSTWYSLDSSFTITQVAPNVDMKVFKLDTVPTGISTAKIYTGTTENIGPATIVGWGIGRGGTALSSTTVAWGDYTTADKRWGINNPHSISVELSYEAIVTYLDQDPDEAAVVDKDSGSPMFQFLDGDWQVIGIATAVTLTGGASTTTFGTTTDNSDRNFFARVSTYSDNIVAIIPEPGSLVLGLILLGACGLKLRPNHP